MSFDGIRNKLVDETALRLAKGKKLKSEHKKQAREIVDAAFEDMWRKKIDQSHAFDAI